jgi:hypothetical protein
LRIRPNQFRGRGIGVDHLQGAGIDNDDGLGREMEQEPVACLGVAEPRVFALHRLLRLDQPLLEEGDGAEIPAHRDDPAPFAHRHGGIKDRDVGTAVNRVIDLPGAGCLAAGPGQHRFHLGPALHRHGVDPRPADPAQPADLGELLVVGRDVLHQAVGIDDEGDVSCGRDELADNVGTHLAK